MQATVIIAPTITTAFVRRVGTAESSHTIVLPLHNLQAIRRSQFPPSSPLQSHARAYASVAEYEGHVFVGDVRVTTFHTHS